MEQIWSRKWWLWASKASNWSLKLPFSNFERQMLKELAAPWRQSVNLSRVRRPKPATVRTSPSTLDHLPLTSPRTPSMWRKLSMTIEEFAKSNDVRDTGSIKGRFVIFHRGLPDSLAVGNCFFGSSWTVWTRGVNTERVAEERSTGCFIFTEDWCGICDCNGWLMETRDRFEKRMINESKRLSFPWTVYIRNVMNLIEKVILLLTGEEPPNLCWKVATVQKMIDQDCRELS